MAAVASLLVARLFRLPEAYWAPITTLVITQSSLGAALSISGQRIVGTVLGALVGAIVASHFRPNALVFGAGVFILGLLCAAVRSDRSAYRFGGVTLATVQGTDCSGMKIAFNRCAEVFNAVALMLTVLFWSFGRAYRETGYRSLSVAACQNETRRSFCGRNVSGQKPCPTKPV